MTRPIRLNQRVRRGVVLSLATVFAMTISGCGGSSSAPPPSSPPPPNQAPVATFTVTCTALDCAVDAAASTDADGTVSSYAWEFGDGGTGAGAMSNYSYSAGGTYTILLTVTDNDGATATDQQDVTVTPPNTPPVAAFASTCSGLDCDFNAGASMDSDGTIATYGWDFGDGNSATGVMVSHSFDADGDYDVVLTITDDDAASASATETVSVVAPALVQVGDPISGIAIDDQDGRVVAISDDGTRVVLGTSLGDAGRVNGGQIRVLELVGGAWVQLGQTLANPDANQRLFGEVRAVALSGDGTRLAAGNQNTLHPDGRRGSVWVYEFIAGQWVQIGATIVPPFSTQPTGLNGYGIAVALSTDGSRLVAGASSSNATDNGLEGAFSVFEFGGGAWNEVGGSVFGAQQGERFGSSVDISGDGNRVIVGAPSYNDLNAGGQVITPGRAFVYDLIGGNWSAVGGPLVGRLDGPGDIRLGSSVDISVDGSRVATFGNFSGDRVRIFELSGNAWTQLGDPIDVVVAFDLHEPMSLTADGNRIAIGGPFLTGNNNGRLAILDWDGTNWAQYAPQAEGEFAGDQLGWSVAITPDGTRAIAGMPSWDGTNQGVVDNRGGARVYDVR